MSDFTSTPRGFMQMVYWESAIKGLQEECLSIVALLRGIAPPSKTRLQESASEIYFRVSLELGPEMDRIRETLGGPVIREYDGLCDSFDEFRSAVHQNRPNRPALWTRILDLYDRCCSLLAAVRDFSIPGVSVREVSSATASVSC